VLHGRKWILVLLALTASGCGSAAPAVVTTPAAPTAAQRAAVTQVVADFLDSYQRAQGPRLCGLLTPRARRNVAARLAAAVPSLRGTPCRRLLVSSDLYGDPRDQPPAIDEAAAFVFRRIRVAGRRALLTFPDGRSWALVKPGRRWLIDALPFVPPSRQS
jgi:hypothetical protein